MVVIADLDEEHGNAAVAAITQAGGQAIFARCDVSSSSDIQATVKAALDRWGRVDVLVNNAAMMTFVPIVDLAEDDWDKVLAVNLKSVFMFCKYAIPHMPQGGDREHQLGPCPRDRGRGRPVRRQQGGDGGVHAGDGVGAGIQEASASIAWPPAPSTRRCSGTTRT